MFCSREFSKLSHRAGSLEDEMLGDKVFQKFKEFGMKSWTDEHFIKVQDSPVSGFNKVVYKDGPEERPRGFLSYSRSGSVTVSDKFNNLEETGVNPAINQVLMWCSGCSALCLLRAGGGLQSAAGQEPQHEWQSHAA